jgi:hypothetical protein
MTKQHALRITLKHVIMQKTSKYGIKKIMTRLGIDYETVKQTEFRPLCWLKRVVLENKLLKNMLLR